MDALKRIVRNYQTKQRCHDPAALRLGHDLRIFCARRRHAGVSLWEGYTPPEKPHQSQIRKGKRA